MRSVLPSTVQKKILNGRRHVFHNLATIEEHDEHDFEIVSTYLNFIVSNLNIR